MVSIDRLRIWHTNLTKDNVLMLTIYATNYCSSSRVTQVIYLRLTITLIVIECRKY